MNLQTNEKLGWQWIEFPDLSEMEHCRITESSVDELLSQGKNKIVGDMSRMEHLYSSAIGLMIRLQKKIQTSGGVMCLVNVSQRLREMFTTINLHKIFPIYATDVEFEISESEVWQKKLDEEKPKFMFVSKVENGICHVILSGFMTTLNDLSGFGDSICSDKADKYIFDFSGLESMDSMAVGLLIRLLKHIGDQGWKIAAFGVSDAVMDLFMMISADELLPMYASEEEAMVALK